MTKLDKRLKKLGFEKVEEDSFGVSYEKIVKKFGFTHVVDIRHKSVINNGDYVMQSYSKHDVYDGGNLCVALTFEEMKLFLKIMKKLKRMNR